MKEKLNMTLETLDEKELEISKLNREADLLKQQKKGAIERMWECQQTIELLRKDRNILTANIMELKKKLETFNFIQQNELMMRERSEEDSSSFIMDIS